MTALWDADESLSAYDLLPRLGGGDPGKHGRGIRGGEVVCRDASEHSPIPHPQGDPG